jgi:adsorption protein B
MIPLWHEHAVIEKMLAHNLAAIRSRDYEVFCGAYPNDPETQSAILRARDRNPRIHLAVCARPGPTSKADCLNAIFEETLKYELRTGTRFAGYVLHDAEDLIHPESFDAIKDAMAHAAMVQVPVLALPTPWHEPIHGIYCDEFAEYQTRDMQVRHRMGAFVPSCGVGTGFRRDAIESLARARNGEPFEPESLTEDYECGLRIHLAGAPQIALRVDPEQLIATREYFPRNWRSAVRQRTRWVMGNALQSWERHGWRGSLGCRYWLWRDRKGLIGNPLSLFANVIFLYGLASALAAAVAQRQWGLAGTIPPALLWLNFALFLERLAVRFRCVERIYGWRFALGVPLRQLCANTLNSAATLLAIGRFTAARLRRRRLDWLKTDHVYPTRSMLTLHKRSFEEVLSASGFISTADLEDALNQLPPGLPIGDLLRSTGRLTEEQFYEVTARQQGLPLENPDPHHIPTRFAHAFPARIAERYRVLPFRVADGSLHLLTPDPPTDAIETALAPFTRLRLEFHLVTESDFHQLKSTLLR